MDAIADFSSCPPHGKTRHVGKAVFSYRLGDPSGRQAASPAELSGGPPAVFVRGAIYTCCVYAKLVRGGLSLRP